MVASRRNYNIVNAEFENIDYNDYPDFCDSFCVYAEYEDGIVLNENELDILNGSDEKYELLIKTIY